MLGPVEYLDRDTVHVYSGCNDVTLIQKTRMCGHIGGKDCVHKELLHTTSILSPSISSMFTMSKVTKTLRKCAEVTQKYREGLEPEAMAYYLEKLAIIGGKDPYELGTQTSYVDLRI